MRTPPHPTNDTSKLRSLLLLAFAASIATLQAALAANGATSPGSGAGAQPPGDPMIVGHALDLTIDPARGTLHGTDCLTLPKGRRQFSFLLHRDLRPEVTGGDAVLEPIGDQDHRQRYRLATSTEDPVMLSYGGRIRHSMQKVTEGMGRSRMQSVGTIDADGVFLGGYTGWYPDISGALLRFELKVRLPSGWLAVSQGTGPVLSSTADHAVIGWREEQPQDEIHLNAARFQLYRQDTPHGEAQAYLRRPDSALATRYLDATATYLGRYSKLIGDYPYAKFALVENFWETGYGMPSFTLLGSRVLRLPFILHSSYPHEILHNWWGNGVYVDYERGNWSEGLTAYLADHLNQELAGRGADYRRDQLRAYADYVDDDQDFPLTAFRGRHGSTSQAVGYGKMLMTAHMLRILLGDDDFRRGLQRFYEDNRFRRADFDDLRIAFEQVGDRDLKPFFDAWTGRNGAAELGLDEVEVTLEPDGSYRVGGSVEQVQADPPLPMVVPVVIHAEGEQPQEILAEFNGRTAAFETRSSGRPLRIGVDPRFDTFRRLLPAEAPVTLSSLFGAEAGLILIPTDADQVLRDGYRSLAQNWLGDHPGWTMVSDSDFAALPDESPVWLLGWENRFVQALDNAGSAFALDAKGRSVTLDGMKHADVSLVVTARRAQQPIGLVAATEPAALPGLARKLPHYGKYGYLLFAGTAPTNQLKGQWPAGDSALMHWFAEPRPTLPLPVRAPLVGR